MKLADFGLYPELRAEVVQAVRGDFEAQNHPESAGQDYFRQFMQTWMEENLTEETSFGKKFLMLKAFEAERESPRTESVGRMNGYFLDHFGDLLAEFLRFRDQNPEAMKGRAVWDSSRVIDSIAQGFGGQKTRRLPKGGGAFSLGVWAEKLAELNSEVFEHVEQSQSVEAQKEKELADLPDWDDEEEFVSFLRGGVGLSSMRFFYSKFYKQFVKQPKRKETDLPPQQRQAFEEGLGFLILHALDSHRFFPFKANILHLSYYHISKLSKKLGARKSLIVQPFAGFEQILALCASVSSDQEIAKRYFVTVVHRVVAPLIDFSEQNERGIIGLLSLFEDLFIEHMRDLYLSLVSKGFYPVYTMGRWLSSCFANVLSAKQCFLMIDRVIGFEALEIFVFFGLGIFKKFESELMKDPREVVLDELLHPAKEEFLATVNHFLFKI